MRELVGFGLLGAVLITFAMVGPSLVKESPVTASVSAAPEIPPPTIPAATEPLHGPLLLQEPSLSKTEIAFAFAGEIWTVSREGGTARRIVTGQLRNRRPIFSPDGTKIAFTGRFDGNVDVYVVAANGGEVRRLTYGPTDDVAVGFTPDGKNVLFNSERTSPREVPKLYTVSITGGLADELPLPSGTDAAYSPDGKQLAYVPFQQWEPGWKKYRGGQTTPIWIADLADSHIVKVPRDGETLRWPMWQGDAVYFVADRDGPFALYASDAKGGAPRLLHRDPNGWDVRYASVGPGAIAFETLGAIHLYDLSTNHEHEVKIEIASELPQARAHFESITGMPILHAALSPTGKRVLFEAHGEIISVPKAKGDVRNLTRTPGVADRAPSWSPDGKWIAWLSDQTGEYALYFRAPDGLGPTHSVSLGIPPSFFYSPQWSPDSKMIAIADKRLNLWLLDLDHPTLQKIDTARFEGSPFDEAWSPDSRSITYVKEIANHLHAIFTYSLDDKTTHQITDGRSDASSPRFDREGKLLYFIASTDAGLAEGGSMTSAMGRAVTSSVYAAVLRKETASPTAPESDEETDAGTPKKNDKKAKMPPIDFEGLDQRIVALPIERANYTSLEVATGAIFLTSTSVALADEDYEERKSANVTIHRYDTKKRKTETFVESSDALVQISANGDDVLYVSEGKWFVVDADKPPKAGDGKLALDAEIWVDPRTEWKQMFHEIWRIERDFLYDPHAHGLDLAKAEKTYEPFLAGISGRADLNALFEEMLSNLVLGHVWASGGYARQDRVNVGLLGADYRIEENRYRIKRILRGENWNPRLRAPLTQPGVDVKEGEFILTVNGQELRGDDDIDRLLQGRADKQTVITVDASSSGAGRSVTVVPIEFEEALRMRTWMEDSRKKVDELSKGRVGYVYLPDTYGDGLSNFDRYYFAEVGKDAVIIDERFNGGGFIADSLVSIMQWTPLMGAATREGEDVMLPLQGIFGPKVMLANEMSGSGGDALPWLFKSAKIGPLVGTRTWGGLVGIGGYPRLIDGGRVTAPRRAGYGTHGEWEVENHGVAPDIEVEQDPALVRKGHDPQLERAVKEALDAIAKAPPKKLAKPPYPDYGERLPRTR